METVQDLIEALSAFPADTLVSAICGENEFSVDNVQIDRYVAVIQLSEV